MSLAVVKRALVTDVAILPGDFTVEGVNYLPGDALTLSATLRNVGDVAVTNAAVSFYAGDPTNGGLLIANRVWEGWLEGAATNAVLSTTWVVPEPATNLTLYAVANPDQTFAEFTVNNNVQTVGVGGTDLSVTLVEAAADPTGSMYVRVQVENVGAPGATNTTLAIRRQGEGGAPLATVEVPALPPGMMAQVAFDLPDDTQPEGNAFYTLNADEASVLWDVETNNNAMTFAVNLWLDSDGDGMPDGWEGDNELNLNDPADASGDADDDGMSNYAEWRAGTDPNDEFSYLAVETCVLAGESPAAEFHLSWGSISNRFYKISRATNLVDGLGFMPIAEHVQADPPVNTYQDTTISTNAVKYYYRIDLE